jgi:hypothetical protein
MGIGFKAELGDFIRRREESFEFGLERELGRTRECARNLTRVGRDLLQGTWTV